jgi:hypothetical protein
MSNPTTPFSWQMPTATDLVTDLPADFQVFGQAVATSMADLLGGTTGQVLSKTTNADMDFTWVTDPGGDITGVTAGVGITGGGTSGTVTVTNDMATTITTNGDLLYGTGSGTYARRAIGSTGNVLTVSGGIPVWSAPAGGGKVLQVVSANYSTATSNSTSTYADTGLTASITPSAATSKVLVIVSQNGCTKSAGNASNRIALRLLRGATSILTAGDYFGYTGGATEIIGESISFSYLDSPSTTSSTAYKTQFQNPVNVASVTVQFTSSHNSTITLLEIGA